MTDLYIRNNKLTRNYNPLTDLIIDYKDVQINNFIYEDIPVIQRLSNKEVILNIVKGLLFAILFYITLVIVIGFAPVGLQ